MAKKCETKPACDEEPIVIKTKPGDAKDIGGGDSEIWNFHQMRLMMSALPGVNASGKKNASEVGSAVVSGLMDLKPQDPIEGMLASQIVVAHEAALDMYRRAWSQPPEYFDARCRYLQMADKAQRTVALLTERFDRHRGAGQQSITVKHVTVNADNAIVGDVNAPPRGWVKTRNQGSTPCNCQYTPAYAVGQKPEAGAHADRQRCRTDAAGCTGERRPALRREIRTP